MARTRAGLLDAAMRVIQKQGHRRTTMTDIAAFAGVAKATLYNHFRTKDDVLSALVTAEVETIAAECQGRSLTDALAHAALLLSGHPCLRRVAADEPAAVARLVTGTEAAGWQAARAAVRSALATADLSTADLSTAGLATADLATAGLAGDDVVLRWLSSYVATPGAPESVREGAQTLVAGLMARRDLPTATDRS